MPNTARMSASVASLIRTRPSLALIRLPALSSQYTFISGRGAVSARFVLMTLLAVCASAQVASITGRVTDPSGAVVPAASISARSVDTGVQAATESTSDGYYTLPALQPGRYELSVSKQGFVPVRQTGIELSV